MFAARIGGVKPPQRHFSAGNLIWGPPTHTPLAPARKGGKIGRSFPHIDSIEPACRFTACGINFIEGFALIRIEIWLIVAFRAVPNERRSQEERP